jgi:hypothetical protein
MKEFNCLMLIMSICKRKKHNQLGERVIFYDPNLNSCYIYCYWDTIRNISDDNDIIHYRGKEGHWYPYYHTFNTYEEALNACNKVYNKMKKENRITDRIKDNYEKHLLALEYLRKNK